MRQRLPDYRDVYTEAVIKPRAAVFDCPTFAFNHLILDHFCLLIVSYNCAATEAQTTGLD